MHLLPDLVDEGPACIRQLGNRHRGGVLAAQKVVPQARTLAEVRALGWTEIDYDRLRGLGAGTPTLL